MKKIGAKRLTPKEQFILRKRIISMCQKGISGKETADLLEVSKFHVSRVWSAYKKEGMAGISLGKRGRRTGMNRKLTKEQEKEIRQKLSINHPINLNLPLHYGHGRLCNH